MTATEERTAPTFEPAWPLDKLTPAPDNPRRDLGDLTELAESIAAVGIVEPLVATTTPETAKTGELLMVAGHRRLAAAAKAGLSHAPVMVHRGLPDDMRLTITVSENLARADLTPTEEAEAFRRLTVDLKVAQRELARRLGVSQPHISRRMALLKLPEAARAAVDAGGIKIETAVKLAALPAKTVEPLFKKDVPGAWGIDRVIEKHDKELAIKAAKAKAAKEGLTVVDPGVCGYNQPGARLWQLDWVDAEAHAGEPCHAVIIGYRGELEPVCTDRARHPEPEGHGEDEDDDQEPAPKDATARAAWEARRKEQEESKAAYAAAKLARREACDWLLADHPQCTAHGLPLLLRSFATFQPYDILSFKEASALLGLDLAAFEAPNDYDAIAERRAFLAYLAIESNHDRAAYALALAHGESAIPQSDWDEPHPERDAEQLALIRLYLHHLAGDGDYHPTAQELVWMGDEAAAPASPEPGGFDPETVKVVKVGKKWEVRCADCGEALPGRSTTEEYAQDRKAAHLETVHGLVPAAAS